MATKQTKELCYLIKASLLKYLDVHTISVAFICQLDHKHTVISTYAKAELMYKRDALTLTQHSQVHLLYFLKLNR